jgi:putative oxidoreductase
MSWIVQSNGDFLPLILRLTLAAVIFPHGAQKALGWFGSYGFRGSMTYFTKSGFPAPLAFLAIAAEFLGPLGLAVGLLTRVAALGIAVVMLVAIMVHKQHGFFMNW